MDTVDYIFSFLCSQHALRSFAICDHTLPFCQRCSGLYLGLALTFIYLLATRHYKKGIGPRSILSVNIVCIGVMLVFGTHLLDPGPAWRLWSGLLFGNAIAYFILPATWQFCKAPANNSYSRGSVPAFFAFFALLNTIPLWFPLDSVAFYLLVNILALIGLVGPLICALVVTGRLLKRIIRFSLLKGLAHE
jgi:uncharacterized membrane protein